MKNLQETIDRTAIGLSLVCALHCLLLPLAVATLPLLAASAGDGHFHSLLLVAVLPTSAIAITLGCRRHRDWRVAALCVPGLAIITLAALFGHDWVGHAGETVLTLLGAGLVALSHLRNQALCRQGRSLRQ